MFRIDPPSDGQRSFIHGHVRRWASRGPVLSGAIRLVALPKSTFGGHLSPTFGGHLSPTFGGRHFLPNPVDNFCQPLLAPNWVIRASEKLSDGSSRNDVECEPSPQPRRCPSGNESPGLG